MSGSFDNLVAKASIQSRSRVEQVLGYGFVRLCADEAQKRQAAQDIRCSEDVVIEMLRNSRDAGAKHIFVGTHRSGTHRHILIIDDGKGIPLSLTKAVFEPRVTSKLDTAHFDAWGMHGRGMALYGIKCNADRAEVMSTVPDEGCSIRVVLSDERTSEKVDQSTFPSFERTAKKNYSMRGPKNILRTACEFSLEHKDACKVYLGSYTEIAATMYALASVNVSRDKKYFAKDEQLPYIDRFARCFDDVSFMETAQSYGLEMSARSSHRILSGEIEPLLPLVEKLEKELLSAQGKSKRPKAKDATTKVLLSPEDEQRLAAEALESFRKIAPTYYLDSDVDPSVQTSATFLTVKIPLISSDGHTVES